MPVQYEFEVEKDGLRGSFVLICGENTSSLLCFGKPRRMEPKLLATLRYLIENRDRRSSVEDLLQAVWPNEFVGETSARRNVSELNRLLGRCIRNFPREGYQFDLAVREQSHPDVPSEAAASAPADPVTQETFHAAGPELRPEAPPASRYVRAALAFAALIAVASVTALIANRAPATNEPAGFDVSPGAAGNLKSLPALIPGLEPSPARLVWQLDTGTTTGIFDNSDDQTYMADISQASQDTLRITQRGPQPWGKVGIKLESVDFDQRPYVTVRVTRVDTDAAFTLRVGDAKWESSILLVSFATQPATFTVDLQKATKWHGRRPIFLILIVEGAGKSVDIDQVSLRYLGPARLEPTA